jgi:adenylate cyclase
MLRDRLGALWDHPWLVGGPDVPGPTLVRRARWMTIVAALLANVIGAAVVVCFALFALPRPDDIDETRAILLNLALAGGYLVFALVVGVAWARRRIEGGRHGIREWIEAGREPTETEQRRALRAPLRIMLVQATLWLGAVLCFTGLNLTISGLLALGVGLTVALGGITTSTATYLLAELALRPVTGRALAAGAPRVGASGVAARWLGTWALGTGVPLVGLILVAIVALTPVDIDLTTLAITTITLAGIGLVAGAVVSLLGAYLTAHPIGTLRRGLERVRAGELDAEIPVWDASELGLLQSGFNEMVGGLREREHLHDLFGRHVGEEAARHALDEGVELGGEVREVVVLFVDIAGATRLAAERGPEEVVGLLNRFFGEVVEAVEEQEGWINKFEGDAALAVFGAPVPVDDAAGRALRAARKLRDRLRERVPELDFGVGVATGEAVAGHLGAERRLEYTVIGDPVNEAARLTELAKEQDERVLASAAVMERAGEEESSRWDLGEGVQLRGRDDQTRLASPQPAASERS